jgi:XTP/dITP diphosphohydrolase
MELVFATNNAHKLEEVRAILQNQFQLRSLADIGFSEGLPETTGTIPGNALQKAKTLFERTGRPCFADDTGLLVEALNNRPGVDTAHYAGPERDSVKNMQRVLSELEGQQNRSARFITVIAYVDGQQECVFEGEVKGAIAQQLTGDGGFGYDPIFIPETYDQSFAELPASVKNEISHRARATALFVNWLQNKVLI